VSSNTDYGSEKSPKNAYSINRNRFYNIDSYNKELNPSQFKGNLKVLQGNLKVLQGNLKVLQGNLKVLRLFSYKN
jgi:hypothetical protein